MPKVKALPRADRKRQILIAFAVEINDGRSGEMTVADIARRINQAPSTKLREMITELVIEGEIDYRTEKIPGVAKFRRIYSPNPEKFKKPAVVYGRQGRAVKINSRQGSFLEQLD